MDGIYLKGAITCSTHVPCEARGDVELEISASIGDGGRVDIDLTPVELPAGWVRGRWSGFLCPEHKEAAR